MSGAVIGGNIRYPNLQSIANLFRVSINDSFSGDTGTPGEGLIMPNTNPDLLTFMNSAIRDLYSDLRNVGDPELILDNYILFGLPALTTANPAVQVSLSYAGFFDGYQWHSQWTLPISCQRVERLWERLTGSDHAFYPMQQTTSGLPSAWQTDGFRVWEMRQGQIWMPGATTQRDLRIRCRIDYPDFLNPATLDFNTAYVPILGCQNAIVAKMLILYARRFAPDQYPTAVQEEARYMGKLELEVVRQQQGAEVQRREFGAEATTDFLWSWNSL